MTIASICRTGAIPSIGHEDYLRFSGLVEARFGLCFPKKRRSELERGITQAFAASTCTDLYQYYCLLQDPDNSLHMQRLVNALTVSESHFSRDAGQFDALRQHVLPQIIERRRPFRTLRIWSAGCANGEEPYSIAILLRELLPDVDEWAITILGTDVNTEAIGRAQKAVYSNWAFREEQAKKWRSRYFRKQNKRYALNPQVRRMVTLAQLNLAEDTYPAYETNTTCMDLILCRNVTIYFTESATRQIATRFYDALVDGGWLVTGHSEYSFVTYHRFQAHNYPGAILYQRPSSPTALSWNWDWQGETTSVADAAAPSPVEVVDTRLDLQPHPILQVDPSEETDSLEQVRDLLAYGHSEQARDLLLELVQSRSAERAPICTLLGQACANLGYWEEAEHWCLEAIRADKLSRDAYYTLALVLQHQGQLDQALGAMRKMVYIDRHHVLGHFGLADLYHANGQLPRALKSLDNARRLLNGWADGDLIPGADGVTVGRLREAVVRHQQQWSAEISR